MRFDLTQHFTDEFQVTYFGVVLRIFVKLQICFFILIIIFIGLFIIFVCTYIGF